MFRFRHIYTKNHVYFSWETLSIVCDQMTVTEYQSRTESTSGNDSSYISPLFCFCCVNGASDLVCRNESGSPHFSLFYRFIMFLFYFRFTNKRLGIIAYIYIHCTTLTILKQNSNIFTIVYIHMYTNTLFNSFSMSYKLYKLKDACVAF